MSEFKISLAAARVNAELSQADVAQYLGVATRTVGNWERRKGIPDVQTAVKLADLYKIPIDYLRFD